MVEPGQFCEIKYFKTKPSKLFVSNNVSFNISPVRQLWFDKCAAEYKRYLKSQGVKVSNTKTNNVPRINWFILSDSDREEFRRYKQQPTKMITFYKWCRKRFNILMNGDKPIGQQWSFDSKNRKPLTKTMADETVVFPTSIEDAKKWLSKFIKNKLELFGPFQDAVIANNGSLLYHSGLSCLINIGFIHPKYVLSRVIKHANKSIESVEGFVRQLFWREYMYLLYEGRDKLKYSTWPIETMQKTLSLNWMSNMEFVNSCIIKAQKTGYLHHIERLIVIGNVLLFNGFKPLHIYNWFMYWFHDAYPWVMYGNVYFMCLYLEKIMSRPYIVSSTYLKKMVLGVSNEDLVKWNKLYVSFVLKQIDVFKHVYLGYSHVKRAKLLKKEYNLRTH
jgi:deoxyribodipyrimidine photolyase-related protein